MSKKLKFKKIEYNKVFCEEFKDLKVNNEIEFNKNIAVLYGPNGTGKTSLSKVLAGDSKDENICFEVEFKGQEKIDSGEIFHIISDQNSRNIIKGSAKDYLIGDDIEKEERLIKEIEEGFKVLCESMRLILKDKLNITTRTNKLIETVEDKEIQKNIKDFANKQFKGNQIDKEKYINKVRDLKKIQSNFNAEDDIYKFIKDNYKDAKSIIYKIMNLNIEDIKQNIKVKEIEENDEAIKIINKFLYKDECVVCDNNKYDKEKLLKDKKTNKLNIENQLDEKTKNILNGIINIVKKQDKDPLNIQNIFLDAIKTGNKDNILELQTKIREYLKNIGNEISNLVKDNLSNELISKYDEYEKLIEKQLKISEEDLLYLKEVIGDNIGRAVNIERDKNNKVRITLDGDELLGKDRDELGLSTGQQNFISLSFELLKAKKSDKLYIVLDDPISSFDSIYKNKIAFCIVKFLEGKKQIILTHNTELIKLLEFQVRGSFELYMFNNTDGAENGFIKVNKNEQDILLQLNKLLDLFRGDILSYIKKGNNREEQYKNNKRFLVVMIPFMRGYANIIGNSQVYKELCKVMHGYESEYVDIGCMYERLFRVKIGKIETNINEILDIDVQNKELIDKTKYPLLNRTLYHTLNYLFLRLIVEKKLCMFENNKVLKIIEVKKKKQGDKYAGETTQNIIDYIFKRSDKSKIKERVFFTSKKTLLNEFNHFEGNMNIFQPAIDITDKALEDEKKSILTELEIQENNQMFDEAAVGLEE
ncbi:AAA family ATPase [uncultured Clostridium sp.]|uniref:AAA family ATPase n=1 Tax=uncultured Clostridium sp. TaxID=59620 RepID=UPI0026154276|nr:AAA family ATPase [uncultured Clostridium sp.]